MYKLLLSLLLLFCFAKGIAQQQKDSSNLLLMAGINIMPFSVSKGYSASTGYALQVGAHRFPVKGIVRFGFPNYSSNITSNHEVNYRIKGGYFMPGAIIYFDDIRENKDVFYLGLMGYFGFYNHHLNLNVVDENWGTSQSYSFGGVERINGFVFEMGGLLTIYKRLKGTGAINTGVVEHSSNPLPQISGFNQEDKFLPGGGRGYSFLIGVTLGLQYQIY